MALVPSLCSLAGTKALVVGLGDTGLSCVRWLMRLGAEVRVADTRATTPHGERLHAEHPELAMHLGELRGEDFAWADMIVASPGVPVSTPEIAAAMAAGKEVVGDVELFARALKSLRHTPNDPQVIAITGSNGKSTVTELTGHLCRAAHRRTVVAGNIGLPVLDALSETLSSDRLPDIWVLELSSFQLETTASLVADAATVLNLSQDHLDRYTGMAGYAAAKARVFGGEATDDDRPIQVLNRDDPLVMRMARPDRRVWTFGLGAGAGEGEWGIVESDGTFWLAEDDTPLAPLADLPIHGLHNAANALAALALCRAVGLPYPPLLKALEGFKGLPHRVQQVAQIDGVAWYDDSKGTNVGATVAALNGFTRPVVLIAGGDGKGQDFAPLGEAVGKARAAVLIGRDAARIEAAIGAACPAHLAGSMEEAVSMAHALALPGDAVLLSPACASFDMFRNYAHRAEVFVAAVKELGKQGHVP